MTLSYNHEIKRQKYDFKRQNYDILDHNYDSHNFEKKVKIMSSWNYDILNQVKIMR